MLQKLRRPVAFVSAVAMTLTMLLYLPVGVFTNNDYGMWANAEENQTTTTTTVKLSDEDNGFFGKEYQEAEKITKQNYKEYGFTADNWEQFEGYYAVENAGQLYWIAQLVNEHGETDFNVVLTDDIVVNYDVLDENGSFNEEKEDSFRQWTPIAIHDDDFSGIFDGNGHTISGLVVIVSSTDNCDDMLGLFGQVYGGTVKNLGIIDSYFETHSYAANYAGVISSYLWDGTIENCYSKSTIVSKTNGSYLGGICGSTQDSVIKNCYNDGIVKLEATTGEDTSSHSNEDANIGGICGYVQAWNAEDSEGAFIEDCYNTASAKVSAQGRFVNVGGICGYSEYFNNNNNSDKKCYTTIQNCYNNGKITATCLSGNVGGICGCNENNIVECYNTAEIEINSDKDTYNNHIGGICGYNKYVCMYKPTTYFTIAIVKECYNTGKITANAQRTYVGGIAGENWYSKIYNCYNHGTLSVKQKDCEVGGIVGMSDGETVCCYNTGSFEISDTVTADTTLGQICGHLYASITDLAEVEQIVTNCYYLVTDIDVDIDEDTENDEDTTDPSVGKITDEEECTVENNSGKLVADFNSGNIAYLLQMAQEVDDNGEVPQVWGQTIMGDKKDDYPVLGGKTVYAHSSCKDDNQIAFSNFEFESDGHSYDDNGFCVFCDDGYEPAVLITFRNEESLGLPSMNYRDCYAIQNAGNLYWFAQQVNNGNTGYKAVLLNDIVVNENVLNSDGTLNTTNSANFRTWTPIGDMNIVYNASFEGNWHTISGLYINGYTGCFGLFGNAGASAHIRNIGVEDSYFNGTGVAGGIVGSLIDGYVNSCYTRCYVNASISTSGTTIAGGIIGGYSADSAGHLYGCYSESYVYAYNAGAIIGNNLSGKEDFDACYYNSDICSKAIGVGQDLTTTIEGHSSENFKNGVVASKLWINGFGQKLTGDDKDDYPKFNAPRVYENYTCSWQYFYSNDEYEEESHVYENGFCKFCDDGYEPATLITEDNYKDFDLTSGYVGYYAIENAGQLYWFANYANGENQSANAVLIDNIVVNKSVLKSDGTLADDTSNFIEWFPIGYYYDRDGNGTYEDVCYNGTFDGQGYTISGLYFNNTNQGYVGLFGQIESGAKVQNVGVIDSYFCAEKHVGGVCGDNNESTVTNCYFSGSVLTISGSFIGGVCGNNRKGTITNCYNIGSVLTTSGGHIGGVCGYNYGTIANCYYSGSVAQYATTAGASSVGGLCCGEQREETLAEFLRLPSIFKECGGSSSGLNLKYQSNPSS